MGAGLSSLSLLSFCFKQFQLTSNVDSLQQKLMSQVDGILAVHEFHIWQLAGDRIIASAHIRCFNLAQYMQVEFSIMEIFIIQTQLFLQVAEKVKEFFHNEGIHSTTIQPEFVENVVTGAAVWTQAAVWTAVTAM